MNIILTERRHLSRLFTAALLALVVLVMPPPAHAQQHQGVHDWDSQISYPSEPYAERVQHLVELLRGGEVKPERFTENFLNAIPPAQIAAFISNVRTEFGEFEQLLSLGKKNNYRANMVLRFERGDASVLMDIEGEAPWRIAGLRLTGLEADEASIEDVMDAIRALPGRTGLGIYRLGKGAPVRLAGFGDDQRFAIASSFKLYILAELDRQIGSGQRRWSDVVRLGPKSHPSGVMQNWPDNSMVTLDTLATQMISISDNTATDTLIRVLGQQSLADMVVRSGHAHPGDLHPFLMTQQVSALKMPSRDDLRNQFLQASEAEQARLIQRYGDQIDLDDIDTGILTSRPRAIEEIEWFASCQDMARLLNYLHNHAQEHSLDIMAVNPVMGEDIADKWRYFGYKGGSEPGVLSLNFLLRHRSGEWLAVSVQWNNPDEPIRENDLFTQLGRLLNLLALRASVHNL